MQLVPVVTKHGALVVAPSSAEAPRYTPEDFGVIVAEILKGYTPEQRASFGRGFLSAFPHRTVDA